MRKMILPLLAALLLTGCGTPKHQPAEPIRMTEAETLPETPPEPATEAPTLDVSERLAELAQMTGTAVVLDEHGHLSEEEAAQCQETLQALSDSKGICTALVITDVLDGNTPERFAAQYYDALFGAQAEGFLLLLNNETGQDYYYCPGTITIADTELRLAMASGDLAEGDYPSALQILLPAAEELLVVPPTEDIPQSDMEAN
ncbi:MAG: TPM domain-containing protein [Oscillospiraceae bacterium]|nr:TPM domain-containing protein [Oscillospiraceae bacterium]